MKKFLKHLFTFFLPVILLLALVIYIDFFKILGFQEYYINQKIGVNREMIATKTYNHYRGSEKFDSFIFGSSRSQAFKCKNWLPYLTQKSKPFHFDASGEGLLGIAQKIKYIDELGDTIKNSLVVIDRSLLNRNHPRKGHLFIPMPIVSKASHVEYYYTFLKASLNPKFLIACLDYSIFQTYRNYMGFLINESKNDEIQNNKNCDVWYGYDKEIEVDSLGFYKRQLKKGALFKRNTTKHERIHISDIEKSHLEVIKSIFEKHSTNYKIIISPIYDQIPMESDQIKLLEKLFGKEHVFNFSGKNKFTEPIHNYYEKSHYRPHLADEILEIIYKK